MNKLPVILWTVAAAIFVLNFLAVIPAEYVQLADIVGTGCLIAAVGLELGFWKTLKSAIKS